MSVSRRELNGDNPHWLCLTLTALPVLIALGLVWASGPETRSRRLRPTSVPETVVVADESTQLAFAVREP
jgi:hypothetical protein